MTLPANCVHRNEHRGREMTTSIEITLTGLAILGSWGLTAVAIAAFGTLYVEKSDSKLAHLLREVF